MKVRLFLFTLILLGVICSSFSINNSLSIPHDLLEKEKPPACFNENLSENRAYTKPIEISPSEMALHPVPHQLQLGYMTSHQSNELIPIDLQTGLQGAPILLQSPPQSIVLSPDGQLVYIAYKDSNQVACFKLSTKTLDYWISLEGTPSHLSLAPNGKTLYVTYEGNNQIFSVDIASQKVQPSILAADVPHALTISQDGKKIYTIQSDLNTISCFDIENNQFQKTFILNDSVNSLVTALDGQTAYTTNPESSQIHCINLESNQYLSSLTLEKQPHHISIHPDGKTAYITQENSREIIPLDLASFQVGQPIILEKNIQHMALHPKQEAIISFHVHTAPVGQPSLFDASMIKPFRDAIHTYTWDFGDGHTASSKMPLITHAYQSSGSFKPTLLITELIEKNPLQVDENEPTANTIALQISSSQLVEIKEASSLDQPVDKQALSHSSQDKALLSPLALSPTTTTLNSSSNPSVFGQSITLTATVASVDPGTPTGIVTFKDGVTTIGTGTLNGSGQAVLSISNLTIGTHSLTAVYGGDANFDASTSPTFSQVVNQASTTTSVASSINPSTFGQSITLTANVIVVSPGVGTPAGTVTFKDGATTLGTGTLNGSGIATVATATLAAGSHSITAVYNGNANFLTSTSSVLTQTVNKSSTATVLTSSLNPSTYGQSITLSAKVNAVSPGAGTPAGTVTFMDGATTLGTGTLNGSGIATLTRATLLAGTHSLTAVYAGNTNFLTSTSSALNQVINPATPTITLSSSLNPSSFGTLVTFTSTVNSPTTVGLPTGTLIFMDGATALGTVTLIGTGANTSTATFSTANLTGGSHSITAVYSGDSNFISVTSVALNQVINPVSTSTTLFSISPNPTEFGETVTLQALITGSVNTPPAVPSGTVQFYDGPTLIGTASANPQSSNTSLAIFPVSNLAIGAHALKAVYLGDINYTGSTSSLMTQNVIQGGTSITLSNPANPSVFGQTLTFTAQVTTDLPASGNPAGLVEFYSGVDLLGTGTLTPSGTNTSTATFATAGLTLGSHTIVAIYPGDSNFTSAVSNLFKQTVNQDPTTTSLTSSLNPSNFGDSVTFTATIHANAPGSGIPTGTVSFYADSTLIGKGTLNGSGVATFSTIALYPGTHAITAIYEGDKNFITSTSSPLTQTVENQLPTVTTVSSGRNSSPTGQSVTFSAKVTAITGIPTGTVTFYDGTLLIGTGTLNSNGVATVTELGADLITLGLHPITAVYSGDPNFITSTSAQFEQYVVPYDTATVLTVNPNPKRSQQANSTLTAVVTATGSPTPIPPLAGTVSFYQGSQLLATVNVDSSGVASWKPNNLHFNSSEVFAVYSGNNTTFATSTSNSITLQVQQTDMLTTQTTVCASPTTAYFCQPVTLSARVKATQGFYSPTGSVTFFSNGVEIGTALLTPNSSPPNSSQASLTLSDLDIGSHTISATYNSDSNYAFSLSSDTVTETIVPNTTTTTLNLIPNLATTPYGDPLFFVANVSSLYSIATGSVTFSDGSTTLATVDLDATGEASFTISSLNVDLHTVTATYNPTPCFLSSSANLTHQINKAKATTSLVVSPSPSSSYGQEVTLKANVSAPFGTPTGIITFYNGTTALGTANLINGTASLTTASLPVGALVLKATYSGDASFISSNLPSAIHLVLKATPTACLLSYTPTPSDFGQPIIFSATVSSDVGHPSGTVTFKDGTTTLGTSTLDNCGVATLQVSSLNMTSHTITATYNGDANFTAAISNSLTPTITQSDTLTTVIVTTPASGSSAFRTSVTFKATVAALNPGSGTPTGNVAFYYGSTLLGTVALANGTASLSTTTLPVGVQTVTAKYVGDTNFTASTGSMTHTVTKVTPTISVTSSVNPSLYGQAITFTVTTTSSAGTPTGVVTFLDGTAVLGVGSLNSGQATFTLSTLSVGSHSITVRYSGDANFNTATSAALTQTVNLITPALTLSSEPNPSVFGEPVIFLANVTSTAGIPTGTVTFKDGTTTLGTVALNNGQAILTTTNLLVGSHLITASYGGSPTFSSTSSTLTQTVNQTSTSISATTSPNPSDLNHPISFIATVSPINIAITNPTVPSPSGTITAYYGSTQIGTGTLISGVATFLSAVNLPSGTHTFIINYAGDTNFAASSTALTQTINQATSTIALASSPNPSIFNNPVTFTATVSPTAATGTVTFSDESGVLGIVAVVSGQATLSLSTLLPGSHTILASYSGDTSFTSAVSVPINQTVNQIGTTTNLVSSTNFSMFGETVTFTSTVVPNSGNATGIVSFFEGTTLLGFSPLSGNVATFTTSTLSVGSHSITATYAGDANFSSSTSNVVTQLVNIAATTASLSSNLSPSLFGQNVTFTATISPNSPAMGLPTGTVTFFDGTTSLGFSNLDTNGQAILTISSLTAGSHNINITYAGDTNFLGSNAALPTQIVGTISTTTILTTSILNPSVFGQTVNFLANVTSSTGTPTGTVNFYEGPTLIGSASLQDGLAICHIQTLTIGSHSIYAVYSGDANFESSTSSSLTQVVNANTIAATSITTLTSNLNPSNFGDLVTFNVTVTPFGGVDVPTGVVSLYNGALPLATLILSSGQATYQTSSLPAGNLQIVAFYSGDANFSASTNVLNQIVNKINTHTDLSSFPSFSTYGESITFTAHVTAPAAGIIPTGTVTFYDGLTILNTSILDGAGRASFTTSTLTSDTHLITAIYNPAPNYNGSNDFLNQQVAAGLTSTLILTSTPNPSLHGEAVTFTAAVTSTVGTPTGTVTFYDGSTVLGTTTLYGGLALLTTQTLTSGSHTITAAYNGKGNFAASNSGPYIQIVQAPLAATNINLTSSLNPSEFGQLVNFTADVSSSLGLPTGTVTFFDGSTSVGTVILDGNGMATLSLANLAIGEHFITATYNGDKFYQISLSTSLLQVVNPSTISEAPQNVQGHQIANKFATETDLVNIITWDPPSTGVPPVSYKIYRNSELTRFVGEVSAQDPLVFEEHHCKKHRQYTYYIVSINQYGKMSPYARIKIKGK